jgi:deoxyhypusine synthase
VDCVVSTGANLYHDLHETRGRRHYRGDPHADDTVLAAERVDRVYDTFADEEEFVENDDWIARFTLELDDRPRTSREFLYRLGERLWRETGADGILTAAYRASVPIFCPGIADSSIGMGLSQAQHQRAGAGVINVIGDIAESSNIVLRHPRTASVVLGGGMPKNFINQAAVQAWFHNRDVEGHAYALQVVTDVPFHGGASGSTLDEAQSWGKVAPTAQRVSVHADATIVLPLLVSALACTAPPRRGTGQPHVFDPSGPALVMGGRPFPEWRYEHP